MAVEETSTVFVSPFQFVRVVCMLEEPKNANGLPAWVRRVLSFSVRPSRAGASMPPALIAASLLAAQKDSHPLMFNASMRRQLFRSAQIA